MDENEKLMLKVRREVFAIAALHGLMSNPNEQNNSPLWPQAFAWCAVQAADALIEELDKQENQHANP